MTISPKTIRNISIAIKIFFIGLFLQFFLHTFFTFQLGLDGGVRSAIRLWKEWIIAGLVVFLLRILIKNKRFSVFLHKFPLKKFLFITIVIAVIITIIAAIFNNTSIAVSLLSLRYTFIWFFIFCIFFAIGRLFFQSQDINFSKWYIRVIKTMLIWWMIRRFIIWLVPALLEFAWYNKFNFEWDVGVAPPVAYYTQMNEGLVRNQFLFERPISRGFFLVAFWPLFFSMAIKNKNNKDIILWGGLYGLNVFSTFSRAAWIAWIVLTAILVLVQFKKQSRKLIFYLFAPLLLLFAWATYFGSSQIINREYSNTGHLEHVLTAIEKIKEKPLFGQWPGTAWPLSHHLEWIKEYNPENQFLQVWIEYGVFWFIWWMGLYFWMMFRWVSAYKKFTNKKSTKVQKQHARIIFAFGLGMLGLTIEGMFLHSFVDRMIVYPFMALFWLSYSMYLKTLPEQKK